MKKIILCFLLFVSTVFSQKNSDLFNSTKLGESLELTIELPDSYQKSVDRKYPLLILLDGDYLFDPFSGALRYGSYWQDLPETIVVGININKNIERENTYSYDENLGTPNGRGAKYFEFIGIELIPYLEKKFRIAPFKIIAGHDLSAGFLNFFLYKENPLFNAYISLSPEFPVNMATILPQRLSAIKQPLFYYQAIADGDVNEIKDTTKKVDEALKISANPAIDYMFDEFKNTSHYSMVLYAIPNALYQIFDNFKPITSADYDKILILKEGYVTYLKKKYIAINKSLGIDMKIRLNDIKAIETAILNNKSFNELDELSDLARKNYPKSMLADYEMALQYENTGDNKKAVKYYQSAFTLNEIGDLTKDMMMEKVTELKKGLQKK
ncbi:MAG: alpha/beta hydrolase [Flavobacterium sp.]|nr:alpha/beta hydrolase [Flavobacterium sp.]